MDQTFRLVQALKKKRRIPAGKALPVPKTQEMTYAGDIIEMLKFLDEEIKKKLFPYLPYAASIITKKIPELGGVKMDAVDDDISRIVRAIKEASTRRFSPEEISRLARKRGISVAKMSREAFERDLKRVAGVDILATDPALELQIGMFAQENVSLISSLINDTMTKVENKVYQGFRSGTRWEDIASDISRYVDPEAGPQANKARFIARDQVSKLNGQLTQARQTGLGITRYIWATSNDERVRDEHAAHEGEIFSWDDPPATGHPGEDFQCRCTAIPYLDDLV